MATGFPTEVQKEMLDRPVRLECCGGEQIAYVSVCDDAEADRVVLVRQHMLWCSCPR